MASIRITENPDGTFAFRHHVSPEAELNQPAGVNQGDEVTWNNMTDRILVVAVVGSEPETTFVTDKIRPGMASEPAFIAGENSTMKYSCVSIDVDDMPYSIHVIGG